MAELLPVVRVNSFRQSSSRVESASLNEDRVQSIASLLPQVLERYLPAEPRGKAGVGNGQQAA